jgi:predicted nuclease of predicted toxin-antitoxin system
VTLWVDAMLSPALARKIRDAFPDVEAFSAQRLGHLDAKDPDLFAKAREAEAVFLTKDEDFALEARRNGQPTVIWVRVGNTSTTALWPVLQRELPGAMAAIARGEPLVEIRP